MSYFNTLAGTLGAKPCGCLAGWSTTFGDVTVLGHISECPETHTPRRYTWTSGGETRTGDLAALVADRDGWLPGLLTGDGHAVAVHADDGERSLHSVPLARFGSAAGLGWAVLVDDERVDIPDMS